MGGLERRLAALLQGGTWLACAVIAAGMAAGLARLVVAGIGLVIALPVVRVAAMLGASARARDWRLAAVAALVLAIIAAAAVAGGAGG